MQARTRNSWLKTNIIYGGMGFGLGLMVYLLLSAASGKLKSTEFLVASITFGTFISLTIANMIHFAHSTKILKSGKNIWLNFTIYYIINLIGMIIAVELAYLVLISIYHWDSKFPHTSDYIFNSIVVLAICTVLNINEYRKTLQANKLQQKELELHKMNELKSNAELDALQAKINPHFLYNALNSIAGLIKENPDQAEDMTIMLSKLFRSSINQSQENLIPVKEEIELLNLYLDIEKIRFGNRIKFVFNIQPGLDSVKIPRFLIQPLVENGLKHGLKHKAEDGYLKIAIFTKAQCLVVQVADNGPAFDTNLVLGYGLESTFNKIQLLYGEEGEVELINSPEKMVQIKMPLSHV